MELSTQQAPAHKKLAKAQAIILSHKSHIIIPGINKSGDAANLLI